MKRNLFLSMTVIMTMILVTGLIFSGCGKTPAAIEEDAEIRVSVSECSDEKTEEKSVAVTEEKKDETESEERMEKHAVPEKAAKITYKENTALAKAAKPEIRKEHPEADNAEKPVKKKVNKPAKEKTTANPEKKESSKPVHPGHGTEYTGHVYEGNKDKDGFELKWVVDYPARDEIEEIYEERYGTFVYDDTLYFEGTDDNHNIDNCYVSTGARINMTVAYLYETEEMCDLHYGGGVYDLTEEEYARLVPTKYWEQCSKKIENLHFGGWYGPVNYKVGEKTVHHDEIGHWEYK